MACVILTLRTLRYHWFTPLQKELFDLPAFPSSSYFIGINVVLQPKLYQHRLVDGHPAQHLRSNSAVNHKPLALFASFAQQLELLLLEPWPNTANLYEASKSAYHSFYVARRKWTLKTRWRTRSTRKIWHYNLFDILMRIPATNRIVEHVQMVSRCSTQSTQLQLPCSTMIPNAFRTLFSSMQLSQPMASAVVSSAHAQHVTTHALQHKTVETQG